MYNAHSHIVRPVNKSSICFYDHLIDAEMKYVYLSNYSNDSINIHYVYSILYFVSLNKNNMQKKH